MSFVAGVPVIEKKQFSMCTEPLMEKLQEFKDRQHVILCGIEAHVCVQQVDYHKLILRVFSRFFSSYSEV